MSTETIVYTDSPCRQKYWGELTLEEKVERVREQVHYLIDDKDDLIAIIYNEILPTLDSHTHLEDGIYTKHNTSRTRTLARGRARIDTGKSDEAYF